MSTDTLIEIRTVGYYHRDKDLKVYPDLLPKRLNENRKYFEDPENHPLPFVNLNLEVKDSGAGELRMESLLEYIRQKGWPNGIPPQFVTNRQLLNVISTSTDSNLEVQVFRHSGVIYMLKVNEETSYSNNYAAVLEHFLTRESEKEKIHEDGIVRKGVFVAEILMDSERTASVLYSGEVDAVDDNNQHLTFKVLIGGMNKYFWENRSCAFYWRAVFGNVENLIIGSRTGKFPKYLGSSEIPEWSVYKIERIPRREIHVKLIKIREHEPSVPYWSISDGEERLAEFLRYVENSAKEDGDAFVMTKKGDEWNINWNRRATEEFRRACLNM